MEAHGVFTCLADCQQTQRLSAAQELRLLQVQTTGEVQMSGSKENCPCVNGERKFIAAFGGWGRKMAV